MKQVEDNRTLDMIGDLPRRRGRPAGDVAPLSAAERKQLQRQRLRDGGKEVLTVVVSREVFDAMHTFLQFKGETQDSLVDRLLRDRLLRKR
ncbi:hypothetical protein RugamoR57_29040 [Duganella caerulea]|uniref:hypothetical protein n=1 Tax=Duganella caerulea TaxID=2885762 RepID=UPI0030E78850